MEYVTNAEFVSLGLTDVDKVEELKQACRHKLYSDMRSMKFDISKNVLESLLDHGFKCDEIASILNVSTRTVYRRLEMYGLTSQNFSDITDDSLDQYVDEIYQVHQNCGEVMLQGLLIQHNVRVTRQRLRDAIHRVDPRGVIDRRRRRLHRRTYYVEGPNRLWHVDGNHKLIR